MTGGARRLLRSAVDADVLRAAAFGVAGGGLFALLSLPAPWLTGSLVAVAAVAVAGVRVRSPDWARFLLYVVLGVIVGATLDPESVRRMIDWPVSLAVYAVCVAVTAWLGGRYLVLTARCDRATAVFGAIPGTLSLVLPLAASAGADVRQVALVQSVRLVALVFLFPLSAGVVQGGGAPTAAAWDWPLLGLLAAALAGAGVAMRLKVPAGALVGSLAVSAGLHATGLSRAMPPDGLVAAALVLLGIMVGVRFVGSQLRDLARLAGIGFGLVVLALAVTAAFAAAAHAWLGFGFAELVLAYAPGGVEAMTLIALSLGLDPAFVGAHHLARMVVMSGLLPVLARRYAPSPR